MTRFYYDTTDDSGSIPTKDRPLIERCFQRAGPWYLSIAPVTTPTGHRLVAMWIEGSLYSFEIDGRHVAVARH
jgi:hypothetical protein